MWGPAAAAGWAAAAAVRHSQVGEFGVAKAEGVLVAAGVNRLRPNQRCSGLLSASIAAPRALS